jgi:DNA ligase-1
MKPKTLFHKGKGGQIVQWTIWTQGPEIRTEYGQIGGKMQTAAKLAESKNVGRSNQTAPEKQAELEAEAMYKKRLEGKYSLTPEDAQSPVFLPMLAHKFEDHKDKITYPVYVQPKLNGVRCLASWDGLGISLMSRGGKDYDVAHLKAQVASFLPDNMVLDGEIYLHGVTFQEVTRLVKKYRPDETEKLQLWVYDVFDPELTDMQWRDRILILNSTVRQKIAVAKTQSIIVLDGQYVDSEREVYLTQAKHVQAGYEGGIVRLPDGSYELGYRSRSLLKVKSFKDDEYRIVDFTHGVGRFSDCIVWTCLTRNGDRFNVVPKGTLEHKRQLLKEAETHIGEMLTVKYFELTEGGVPQFPVGLGFKEGG